MTDPAARAAGYLVHLELSGPCLVDYTPKVRRLSRWEQIIEYLKALYR